MAFTMRLTDNAGVVVEAVTGVESGQLLMDLEGWLGGVGVRSDRTDRLGNGTMKTPVWRTGRELTASGITDCDDRQAAEIVARRLSGLFPSPESGNAFGVLAGRHDGGDWLYCDVKLDGTIKITIDADRFGGIDGRIVSWEIPLYADDPYLYSAGRSVRVSSGSGDAGLVWPLFSEGDVLTWGTSDVETTQIVNRGNSEAFPTVTVLGDFPSGFRLGDGHGRWVVWRRPCYPTTPVLVDFATHSVTVGGADQSFALTSRDFWSVPADGVVAPVFEPLQAGSGYADFVVRDRYL